MVIIKRVIKENGDHYFFVYKDERYISCAYFEPNAKQGSVLSEETAYEKALSKAKEIENNTYNPSETIVYQSPENK